MEAEYSKAPNAHCDECPLREQPHVFGRGPDNPRVVIIGEAPGLMEVKSGIPFTGKSGQLLNKVLRHHGVEREELYITNTVLCRPPGNRTPTAKEIKFCRDRLATEVQARHPEAVLALGAVASKNALQTSDGISVVRIGGAKWSDLLQCKVIPTFHPAAALRNPGLFPSIVSDIKKITQPIEVVWEPTKYDVCDDESKTFDMLANQIQHARDNLISLDVEVAPPFDRHNPDFLCIGLSETPGRATVYTKRIVDSKAFRYNLAVFFSDYRIRWLMQNGKFDTQELWSFAPQAHVNEDTMLMHYSTDERKGTHALEQLTTEILGSPNYKTEAKAALEDKADLTKLPPELLYQYNATDCDGAYRLVDPLRKEMASDGVEDVYRDLLIPADNALAHMEYHGIRLDLEYLNGISEELTEKDHRLAEELTQWVDNPRSPQQVKAALWKMGHKVPSTNEDIIKDIKEPFVEKLLDYRGTHKLLSTYVKSLINHTVRGRIHSSFNIHGTETGRLSSSDPNVQNIPLGDYIRKAFTADSEDRVLLNMDYSGIELRLAAELTGDPWLTGVFMEGRKLHQEVAEELYGPDYTPLQYRKTKNVNFSVIYEIGPTALAHKYLDGNVKEAARMIKAWERRSPVLFKDYREGIQKEILTNGYLRSYFGRLRRFWLVTYENQSEVFREGYNFPIQSMASDITLRALIKLEKMFRNTEVYVVATVHDSIMFDVPKDQVLEVAKTVQDVMEDTEFKIPILAEYKYNYRWEGQEVV